jgi:outer membrane protein
MKIAKRFFLGALLSLFVLSMNAQTGAGKILLGGSSSFDFGAYTEKYKSDDGDGTDGKGISVNLAPQAGFFVMDGLAVGLSLNLGLDSYKPDGAEDRYSMTTIVAAPFVRYYYGDAPLKPFAEATVGLGAVKMKQPDFMGEGTITSTTNVFGFGVKVGAAYFVNDNVSIDLGIGYTSQSYKDKEDNDANYKDVTGTIGLQVGIIVVL